MQFKPLIIGFLLGLFGQILGWFQVYGSIVWPNLKPYMWWIVLLVSAPIGYIFIFSTRYIVEAFGGLLWPSRIIGFCAGVIIFAILSSVFMKEHINMKTLVSLLLCFVILLIQITWKTE